jgi:hypothetical protein
MEALTIHKVHDNYGIVFQKKDGVKIKYLVKMLIFDDDPQSQSHETIDVGGEFDDKILTMAASQDQLILATSAGKLLIFNTLEGEQYKYENEPLTEIVLESQNKSIT